MRRMALGIGAVAMVLSVAATGAAGEPVSGPRETVDQSFTTTRPDSPTGVDFQGTYHATGDESAPPPPMPRMTSDPPPGMRFDTSVPAQCTANDAELQLLGPAACPAGSQVGTGEAEGLFLQPITHDVVWDRFTHPVYILNNANEQILLIHSEGYTVVRGRFQPDGSQVFDMPTCFPVPPTGCADDYIITLASAATIPPYTTASGSYITTPPTCPTDGYWKTTMGFEWSDGQTDTVVSREPCKGRRR